MNKTVKIVLIGLIAVGVLIAIARVIKTNSTPVKTYKTEKIFKTNIVNKVVATGKVNPEKEVAIKPQIGGTIEAILVEEGDQVKKGDLIARIRVVPNAQNLAAAQGRVKTAKLSFDNAKTLFERNKALFDKGVISKQDFENSELSFNQAMESLKQAQNDYQIIKKGSIIGSGSAANTNIIAQIEGTILEIPVKEGDQVIESNTFNAGTTVATIADMSKMIFEGKVDEAEVGKLTENLAIDVSLGALEDTEFPAKLTFVAPKGNEENGAVQFKIKADVVLKDNNVNVRAGYSANASIVLEKKDSVFAIREALVQYDKETEKPFVEVEKSIQEFEKRNVELGVSDGLNVEIISGINEDEEIKVWNKTKEEDEKDKRRRGNN